MAQLGLWGFVLLCFTRFSRGFGVWMGLGRSAPKSRQIRSCRDCNIFWAEDAGCWDSYCKASAQGKKPEPCRHSGSFVTVGFGRCHRTESCASLVAS